MADEVGFRRQKHMCYGLGHEKHCALPSENCIQSGGSQVNPKGYIRTVCGTLVLMSMSQHIGYQLGQAHLSTLYWPSVELNVYIPLPYVHI